MIIVGTTNFDELIKAIDTEEILSLFLRFGFSHIIFQIGKLPNLNPSKLKTLNEAGFTHLQISKNLKSSQLKHTNISQLMKTI